MWKLFKLGPSKKELKKRIAELEQQVEYLESKLKPRRNARKRKVSKANSKA